MGSSLLKGVAPFKIEGGGVTQSFFARTREELEEFCRDWGFDVSEIQENVATVQTL